MKKQTFSSQSRSKGSSVSRPKSASKGTRSRNRRGSDMSDVLISAVISPSLLAHLHHVLQRAEYGADQEGRVNQAANFAQLRKVLCMDARSMEDASAIGIRDNQLEKFNDARIRSRVA